MKPTLLVHGPTASGKTALSVVLAQKLDGEIVNADSIQVYRDLEILSGRPDESEMQGIPHHLFGFVAASERYSIGKWLDLASSVIDEIHCRGKVAIVVGGTGLYHQCLVDGLSTIPSVDESVRVDVERMLKAGKASVLWAKLAQVDPDTTARIDRNDHQRLARAFGVWLMTGTPISDFQACRQKPVLSSGEWLGVALFPERARLYSRIDARFDHMLEHGILEEASRLMVQELPPDLPAMKAHGMPWLLAFLRNEISRETASMQAKRDTRRYAKRQFTWIARQFPFWPRIPGEKINKQSKVVSSLYKQIDGELQAR